MAPSNQRKGKEATNARAGREADAQLTAATEGGGTGGAPAKSQDNPRQDDAENSQARLLTQGSVSCAGRQHKRSTKGKATADAKEEDNNDNKDNTNNPRARKLPGRGLG